MNEIGHANAAPAGTIALFPTDAFGCVASGVRNCGASETLIRVRAYGKITGGGTADVAVYSVTGSPPRPSSLVAVVATLTFADTIGEVQSGVISETLPTGDHCLCIGNVSGILTLGNDPEVSGTSISDNGTDLAATFGHQSFNGNIIAVSGDITVSSSLTITDAGDESFRVGETGVEITVTNGGATQGTGSVRICPSNDVEDENGVALTVTSWSDTGITFDVPGDLSPLVPRNTNVYLFVTNDAGQSNSDGYVVQITPPPAVLASLLLLN